MQNPKTKRKTISNLIKKMIFLKEKCLRKRRHFYEEQLQQQEQLFTCKI
jgi:hypothetical protein